MKFVTVAIGEGKIVQGADALVSYALGSCVGICLYDQNKKIAGMVHILLPHELGSLHDQNDFKYADRGIKALVDLMVQAGADYYHLTAKIAGGAEMFVHSASKAPVGQRNVEAVKEILGQLKIPIIASDTGKNYGRTIRFYSQDGVLEIKSIKYNSKEI